MSDSAEYEKKMCVWWVDYGDNYDEIMTMMMMKMWKSAGVISSTTHFNLFNYEAGKLSPTVFSRQDGEIL